MLLVFAAAAAGTSRAGELLVRVLDANDKPVAGAVVTARSLVPAARAILAEDAVMDQIDRRFTPNIVVVPVGSRVAFPNSDDVSHQVYSFSPARKFQLPLYRGEKHRPVQFDVAGLVTVGCNIHDGMLGYILVTDAQYFGRAAADGSWVTKKILPGRYQVKVWHPDLPLQGADLQTMVEIADSKPATVWIARGSGAQVSTGRSISGPGWDSY